MKSCVSFQFPVLRSTLIILMGKHHLYITAKNKTAECSILQSKRNSKTITLPKKPKQTPHLCHRSILCWNTHSKNIFCSWEFLVLNCWIFEYSYLLNKKKLLEIYFVFFLQSRHFLLQKNWSALKNWLDTETHVKHTSKVSEFTLSELITHSASQSTLNCWHTKHTKNEMCVQNHFLLWWSINSEEKPARPQGK